MSKVKSYRNTWRRRALNWFPLQWEKFNERTNRKMYIRTQGGATDYYPTDAAIEQWLSEDGYRVSFFVKGYEFTMWIGSDSVRKSNNDLNSAFIENVNVEIRRRK